MISKRKLSKRKLDTQSNDHTEATDHCSPGVPEKKKARNADPGVRIQGGRIYCSKTGTTCHQCRQKTVEDKRQCTTCNQQWCPKCLTNRYGPQQEQASREPKWSCPKCLKSCSCSYCRKKAGLAPTGILATTAKSLGFASVAELLEANPDAAKAVQAAKEVKTSQANKPEDAAAGRMKSTPSKAGTKRKNSEACEEVPAVPDQDLPPCLHPIPAAKMLALQKLTGPGASWPKALPADCTAGDLLEVMEFVQVFSHHLSCSAAPAAALAVELLQDCSAEVQLQEGRSSSLSAQLHIQLLSVLCKAQEERIRLTSRNWQQELCHRFLHKAPKPDAPSAVEPTTGQGLHGCKAQGIAPGAAGQDGQGCKGYWQLAPGVRLSLLKKLCYAVLNTYIFRQHIEGAMEESCSQEKLQREAALERRKQARTDVKRLQEQEIALLIASGQGEGMTLEEQKSKLAAARAKAQGALGTGHCGDLSSGSSMAGRGVRGFPLGVDRQGACYWKLQAAEAFGGGLLVQSGDLDSTEGKEDWGLHEDTTAVAAALDARGVNEGLLKKSIAAAFPSAGTADPVVQLAPISRDGGAKRAVPTAPKGKRPTTKSKGGPQQDTTAAAVAVKDASTTGSAVACAAQVEGKLCVKDCSTGAAGQCVRKGPARKTKMTKGEQKQYLTFPGKDVEAAGTANNENSCLAANC